MECDELISVTRLCVFIGISSVRYFLDLIPDVSLAISISESIDSICILSSLRISLSLCERDLFTKYM